MNSAQILKKLIRKLVFHSIEKSGILKKNKYIYLYTYFIFALGGVRVISDPKYTKVIIFALLIVTTIIHIRKSSIDKGFIFIILFITFIFSIQALIFEAGDLINLGYLIMEFGTPYLALKLIGRGFTKYYINTLYFFSILSLIFYLASSFSSTFYSFQETLANIIDPNITLKKNFLIYTWEPGLGFLDTLRNPGPFWEPGVFAVYLIIGLLLNLTINSKFNNKYNVVFVICLLTTQSTAGFISLFTLIFLFFLFLVKGAFRKSILIILFLVVVPPIFSSLDFMESKLENHYEREIDVSLNTPTAGRFLAARKSLYTFSHYPLTGKGLILATSGADNTPFGGGYGLLQIAARLGIFGFIGYFLLFYKGFNKFNFENHSNKYIPIIATLTILGVLLGQNLYFSPIYLMVCYYSITHFQYTNKPSIVESRNSKHTPF